MLASSGTVSVDAESGRIWRVVMSTTRTPWSLASTDTYDYDEVAIGSIRKTVLVSRVETALYTDHEERIEWTFSNFRRFQVDASITYGSPE